MDLLELGEKENPEENMSETLAALLATQPPEMFVDFPFFFSVQTRISRNASWELSSYKPRKIAKMRRLVVELPNSSMEIKIEFNLQLLSGSENNISCSLGPKQWSQHSNLNTCSFIVQGSENEARECICYLFVTPVVSSPKTQRPKYKLVVSCTIKSYTAQLYQFSFFPMRSHNFESRKKRNQNISESSIRKCIVQIPKDHLPESFEAANSEGGKVSPSIHSDPKDFEIITNISDELLPQWFTGIGPSDDFD